MSFQPDNGNRINQVYVLNSDASNPMYRGMVPAKMNCDQSLFEQLPSDPASYPMNATLICVNKTQGGKTVQHALSMQKESTSRKAS